MAKRKNYYVYAHRDPFGNIFYIGKGTGRRAWSKDRDIVWKRYVDERLGGRYEVEILTNNLSDLEAESLEWELINEHGQGLVNWINPGRQFDYIAIAKYHALRDANRRLVAETQKLEKKDIIQAVAQYREALDKLRDYENIVLERGLVAELSAGPKHGDVTIIDRLTQCLEKLGRIDEAIAEAERYFMDFPFDKEMVSGKRVLLRIEELKSKLMKYNFNDSSTPKSDS